MARFWLHCPFRSTEVGLALRERSQLLTRAFGRVDSAIAVIDVSCILRVRAAIRPPGPALVLPELCADLATAPSQLSVNVPASLFNRNEEKIWY
jgi:hypothetical protein